MPPIYLHTGERFGNLTYLKEAERRTLPSGQKPRRAIVQCDCGKIKDVLVLHLVRGRIVSCNECFIPSKYRTEEVGKTYGTLTILQELGDIMSKGRRFRMVEAECVCGSIYEYRLTNLKIQKSCGCLTSSIISERLTIHGQRGTRVYGIWQNMKNRCRNKNVDSYKFYGAKGITFCEDWEIFENFYKWAMDNGYEDHLTIDRYPNRSGNYEPSNCRWATYTQQANNRDSNFWVTYKGETMSLADLCHKYNLVYGRVQARIKYLKWPIEECVEKEWQDPISNLNFINASRRTA